MNSGFHSEISSLISQLRSLVPTMHKCPMLGYCAIYPVPLLGTFPQDKGGSSDGQRLPPGFRGLSDVVSFDHGRHLGAPSCGQMCFSSLCSGLISVCSRPFSLCTCVSSSLPPLCLPSLYCLLTQDIFPSTKCSNTFVTLG